MRIGQRICHTSRGAAIVEFALILPLLSMMALGMLTGGIALDKKQYINNAAREDARCGATVDEHECDDPLLDCDGMNWANLVRSVAVQRSNGAVVTADVCVALVSGPGWAPVAFSATHTTNSGSYCYIDNSSDTELRVQVSVTRSGQLQAVLFTMTLNLSSKATARFET